MNILATYLDNTDDIPRHLVCDAMQSLRLDDLAIVREIIVEHRSRVTPLLNANACHEFVVYYYLKCISDDSVAGGFVHSRFEAARELCRLLSHWEGLHDKPEKAIEILVEGVTESFLAGDRLRRNAIETGFLEHVLEESRLAKLFGKWKSDPILKEAYDAAKCWADSKKQE